MAQDKQNNNKKKMSTNVMIDLETFSTEPNASIATIGAIKFSTQPGLAPLKDCNTFYRRIDRNSCKIAGLHESEDVLKWWETQKDETKVEIFEQKDRVHLIDALKDFATWFGTDNNTRVWAQGAGFDIIIMESAFKKYKINIPWKFWNVRDTRTIYEGAGLKFPRQEGTRHHHALYDCHIQIDNVKKSFEKIKSSI